MQLLAGSPRPPPCRSPAPSPAPQSPPYRGPAQAGAYRGLRAMARWSPAPLCGPGRPGPILGSGRSLHKEFGTKAHGTATCPAGRHGRSPPRGRGLHRCPPPRRPRSGPQLTGALPSDQLSLIQFRKNKAFCVVPPLAPARPHAPS